MNDYEVLLQAEPYKLLLVKNIDILQEMENNTNKETQQVFRKLVDNFVKDKCCLSALLGYFDDKGERIIIISGNHRLKAIREAKINKVLVIVPNNFTHKDIVRWHLSHNAISGDLVEENLRKLLLNIDFGEIDKKLSCLDLLEKKIALGMESVKISIESFDEKPILADLIFYNDSFADFKKKYEEAKLSDEEPKVFTGISKENFNKCILYLKEKKNVFRIDQLLIKLLEDASKIKE